MFVVCLYSMHAAVCHYRRFVCVSGAAVRVRSGRRQDLTRTSSESNLVTAQSTAHEPPEDGRTYGPKHVGTTSLKCF